MTELDYIENGMRLRRSKELGAVRAENVLMRLAMSRQCRSLMSSVENVFNGHPLSRDEVCAMFPLTPRPQVLASIAALKQDGRLLSVKRGVYQKS